MTFYPIDPRRYKTPRNLSAKTKKRHAKQCFSDGAQASLVTGLLVAAVPLTGGFSLLFALLSGAAAVGNLASSIPPPGGYKDDNNPDWDPIR